MAVSDALASRLLTQNPGRTLEDLISAAHFQGEKETLARLQSIYRRTRSVTRYGGTMTLKDCTRPATRQKARSRSTIELPELRSSGPRFEVVLGWGALSTIEHECRDILFRSGGSFVETGGKLYSMNRPRHDGSHIAIATDAGPDGRHAPGRVELSTDTRIEEQFSESRKRAGLVRVGDWHTHSVRKGPSDVDLRAWGAAWRACGGSWSYVGLIASPGPQSGWQVPLLTAYVVRRDGDRRLVCESATVKEF